METHVRKTEKRHLRNAKGLIGGTVLAVVGLFFANTSITYMLIFPL